MGKTAPVFAGLSVLYIDDNRFSGEKFIIFD